MLPLFQTACVFLIFSGFAFAGFPAFFICLKVRIYHNFSYTFAGRCEIGFDVSLPECLKIYVVIHA